MNYKTKKALKAAVARGDNVSFFQPRPFDGNIPSDGKIMVEGPHAPEPHRWYADVTIKGGKAVKVS